MLKEYTLNVLIHLGLEIFLMVILKISWFYYVCANAVFAFSFSLSGFSGHMLITGKTLPMSPLHQWIKSSFRGLF